MYIAGIPLPGEITVGSLTTSVRNNVGDEESTSDFFRDRDIVRWLNEGILDFARRTKAFVTTKTVNLVVGQNEYSLPQGFRGFDEVRLNGFVIRRTRASDITLPVADGNASFYSIANGKLKLNAAPTEAGTMTWLYFYLPFIENSIYRTVVNINHEYTPIIINYASAQAALLMPEKAGGKDTYFLRMYEDGVLRVAGEVEDIKESADVEIKNVFNPYTNEFSGDGANEFWYVNGYLRDMTAFW